jgi:hypothetical protein
MTFRSPVHPFRTWLPAFVAALLLASTTFAGPPYARPAVLASAGQSSDIVVVKALLNTQLKLDLAVKPVAQPADLAGMKTLVLVVGSSAKGLGAAGLDMEKEVARTKALLAAAKEQKIPVVVMHTGGESRRGKTSNDLIDLVVPDADYVVVVAGGNKDKVFNTLAARSKATVVEVAKLAEAGAAMKTAFGQ